MEPDRFRQVATLGDAVAPSLADGVQGLDDPGRRSAPAELGDAACGLHGVPLRPKGGFAPDDCPNKP